MTVLSVLLLAVVVAASVALVVRTALHGRRIDDPDAPLDEHLATARASAADAQEAVSKFLLGRGKHRSMSVRRFLFSGTGSGR